MKLKKTVKNIVIFGDSYSTFKGFIPEGYSSWYSETVQPERTDVCRVEETWWHSLREELDLNIVRNDSWSGSTIGFTGYGGEDLSGAKSFIARLLKLEAEGFFKQEIDTVIIFGGTNDSWADAPLGELKLSSFERDDFYSVLPSICFFISKVKENLPEANIVTVINTGLKPEISEALKTASGHFGASFLELSDIGKQSGHPNVSGMRDIKEQVKEFLLAN